MAKTTQSKQFKIDATRPFYAVVGAGDLAVEIARTAATDAQTRFAKVDFEPKALRDQAQTQAQALRDQAQTQAQALRDQAQALPAKVESYVTEAVAELNETVAELNGSYTELAARGKSLVNRIRKQQATQDAKAAGKTTVAKAKTARTQTTKSASQSAATTKTAAKKTAGTAKRNVKSTTTAAKKTASASVEATTDAASKVGN